MSWVVDAFGSWYLAVYPHRNEAEAVHLIGTLARAVALSGQPVLDVGCGAGRHLRPLREAGARPTGLDLSPALLAEARRHREDVSGHWPLVRGDMRRLPFRDGSFAGVTSLFTSFGYFGDEENRRALGEGARVLRVGGFHLLDFLNRERVDRHSRPETERVQEGWRIRERRRVDGGRVVRKRVTVTPASGGPPVADYEERVTLYGPDELRGLLRGVGLIPAQEWGDYDGSPFDPPTSPRHLLLSRREGE